ncbi:MAG: hypothetical protein RBU30_05100 [Polyangia bacterium]|jgi:hypothetical protein|nr:hypothetical protein [Polyangia bacterium]
MKKRSLSLIALALFGSGCGDPIDPGNSNANWNIPTPVLVSLTPVEGVSNLPGQDRFVVEGSHITCQGPSVQLSLAFSMTPDGNALEHLNPDLESCSSEGFTVWGNPGSLAPGTYWAFIDEGGPYYSQPTSNRIQVQIRPAFLVTGLSIVQVEQHERVLLRAAGYGVNCDEMPTMSLELEGEAVETFTAVSCAESYNFELDFAPSAAPGIYDLSFVNGNGLPTDRPPELGFEVKPFCGLDDLGLGPGLRPSLAIAEYRSGGANNSLVAAIHPTSGHIVFSPRSRDFASEQSAPVTSPVVAREVKIASTDDHGDSYYGAAWASDAQIGVLWLRSWGVEASPGPPPIETASPTELRLARGGTFGDEWAITWRDGDGAIHFALTTNDATGWTYTDLANPVSDLGEMPRIAPADSGFYDYRIAWQDAEGVMRSRWVTDEGPVGEETVHDQYGRKMCNYHPETSTIRICHDSFSLLVEIGPDFVFPHYAGPQTHPAELAGYYFMAYTDVLGGTTYALYSDFYDSLRLFGRINRGRDHEVPPQLIEGPDVYAWVAQDQGNVIVGTVCK